MKKVSLLMLVALILLLAFTSCAKIQEIKNKITGNTDTVECVHEWADATCQAPKTCKLCQATEGSTVGHKPIAPTCTTPTICSVCNATSEFWAGALGHDWKEATCTTAKTCRTCGEVESEALGHIWIDPTCLDEGYCSTCNFPNPEAPALGHEYAKVEAVDPTCTKTGFTEGSACVRCNEYEEGKACTVIPAKGHTETVTEGLAPTCTEAGYTEGKKCTVCDQVTEKPIDLDPLGHQRFHEDDNGDIDYDGFVSTVYPVNPDTGLAYNACESDGTTVYTCYVCKNNVEVAEPKVHHDYGEGATCSDTDAVCTYCGKSIEHEYADATCTEPSKCIICSEVYEGSVSLGHNMLPATCLASPTCDRCGYAEGERLSHTITSQYHKGYGTMIYSCTTCSVEYKIETGYYLDGSNHDNMSPVNNYFGGYTVNYYDNGEYSHLPAIETDANGNKYYKLIHESEPRADEKGKNDYPPQLQIWVPNQRAGFGDFSSLNGSVGFFSIKINTYMDKNLGFKFVEGSEGWDAGAVIVDDFLTFVPYVAPETEGEDVDTHAYLYGWSYQVGVDENNEPIMQSLELFKKDVAGITDPNELFTGWLDIKIGIVLDAATDSIILHYYVDGEYKGTVAKPLTTLGNSIKCVYISGNTNTIGTGLLFDDLAFGHTPAGAWPYDGVCTNHNFATVTVDPTCITDGYTLSTCSLCGYVKRSVSSAFGHDAVLMDGLAPTCDADGYTAYSVCGREGCGVDVVSKEVIPATGHDYVQFGLAWEPTCDGDGSIYYVCSICGGDHEEVIPMLGHDYPTDAKCGESAICNRCSQPSARLPHDYAPATCTEPQTCKRDGCSVTMGDPLGHDLIAPTCTTPYTCSRCDHTEGTRIPHTLAHKYVKSVLTYYCTGCDVSYAIETGYYLDGAGYTGMSSQASNSDNYNVAAGTQLPVINSGYYEYINKSGNGGQLQFWVPQDDTSDAAAKFGFSSANGAVGFLSFKMSLNMSSEMTVWIVDSVVNQGDDRWTNRGVAGKLVISPADSNGAVKFTLGTLDGYRSLVNQHVIAEPTTGSNGFSEWVDIKIGIVLDPVADQITYHCYTNGEYVTSFSAELAVKSNAICALYFSGTTSAFGTGLKIDDLAFGYTANGEWVFDDCTHTTTSKTYDPTCTTDGYTKHTCSLCGHVTITDVIPAYGHTKVADPTCTLGALCGTCEKYYGEPDGHKGGKATCEASAVCEVCKKPYGEPSHDMVEATCSSAAYCKACEKVFGSAVSHNPQAVLNGSVVTYSCKYCEASYTLENSYYHDVENDKGGLILVDEKSVYAGGIRENGSYEFVHDDTSTLGKAWVWIPTNGTGINDFENFSKFTGAVGALSFSLDAYCSSGYEVSLIDSDFRAEKSFWTAYTVKILTFSAPSNNVVTLMGWNSTKIADITVGDDMYTGKFDMDIGIEMGTDGIMTLHYYYNGQYVTSVSGALPVVSGKIDGVSFLGTSNVAGSGYRLDDFAFGYAVPSTGNPAPVAPKAES